MLKLCRCVLPNHAHLLLFMWLINWYLASVLLVISIVRINHSSCSVSYLFVAWTSYIYFTCCNIRSVCILYSINVACNVCFFKPHFDPHGFQMSSYPNILRWASGGENLSWTAEESSFLCTYETVRGTYSKKQIFFSTETIFKKRIVLCSALKVTLMPSLLFYYLFIMCFARKEWAGKCNYVNDLNRIVWVLISISVKCFVV